MAKILVGVDAGSYTFAPSANQITISGIDGLSIQSIQMVVDQTVGKILYIFNGLPATFIDNVLTLNSSTDLEGCQNTDELSIYVEGKYYVPTMSNNGNSFNVDLPSWNVLPSVTSFLPNSVDGPILGTKGHHITISNGGLDAGLSSDYINLINSKTAGVPIRFSVWLRSESSFTGQLNLFIGYPDATRDTFSLFPSLTNVWKRYTVYGQILRNDGYSIQAYLHTGEITPKTFDAFGVDLRIGNNGVSDYSLPSGNVECVEIDSNKCTSIAAWGDSLTNTDWMQYCSQYFRSAPYYNGGVGGESSTQIKTRMLADPIKTNYGVTVIWAGRNNITDETTILSDIASMVGSLPNDRFLVCTVTNSTSEVSGSANYNHAISINNSLLNSYGKRCVDARKLYCVGTSGDIPRPEYTSDGVHPTPVFKAILANEISNAIKLNGWA